MKIREKLLRHLLKTWEVFIESLSPDADNTKEVKEFGERQKLLTDLVMKQPDEDSQDWNSNIT